MTSAERRPLLDSYVRQRSLYPYLKQVVSAKGSKISLTLYCLVTGIVSAVAIETAGTWVGFMTGNTIQLAMAVPNIAMGKHDVKELTIDLRRFLVLITFILGSFITSRIGPRGPRKQTRSWVIGSALVHAVLLAVTAGLIRASEVHWKRDGPLVGGPWSDAPGMLGGVLLAFVLGCQGSAALQLDTTFRSTVVLTTTWLELVSDPLLFSLSGNPERKQRILAILGLVFGAIIAELVSNAAGGKDEGGSLAIGVASAISGIGALRWWWVKEAVFDSDEDE